MSRMTVLASLSLLTLAAAQSGFTPPIAQPCPGLESSQNVACINNYAAVLPYPFERGFAVDGNDPDNDTFIDTSVPSDTSFELVHNATFLVFDQERGLDILGSSPRLERIFNTRNDSIHEAPVYVPGLNVIIYSLPHQGIYEQQIINLNNTPPTIENYTTSPPVYAVNGGKYYQGEIYWALEASFPFPDPNNSSKTIQQAPGIYKLNPYTNKTTTLINNYFGTLLNSPNDLFIDSRGDIFFTDSWYGYAINVTSYPVHSPATYRFRPSTGALSIVENTLDQPNGIGISPDGRTMYISDTGITDFEGVDPNVLPRYRYNPFGGKSLYAYDINFAPPGNYLTGKRPIWLAQTFAVDGFHVSREGYLLGAAGNGIDVLSEYGELLVRIEIGGSVNNFQFVGKERDELWAFGPSGIWRISGLGNIHGMREE
ncbi:Gluconolactonase [Pseudocercospora fuligena]|uniref:Gluconolactonase n=1 Tax=Pseudocercospora fuligena TaxID=685502 RepID=A0A8H6VL33_9PEZI|nr:Gluconolactonase [Pseudocercospora fuligena]